MMGSYLPLFYVSFHGATQIVENVVIDTGATRTMISSDAVQDIGIFAELGDGVRAFRGFGGSLHSSAMPAPADRTGITRNL